MPGGYGPGMAERLVVIGGDAAGMSAASGVRRAQPETEVVVLEKGGRTSYAACGIPFFVSGDVDDVESLVARTPEEFEAQGIQVRMHTEALGIDLDARTVRGAGPRQRGRRHHRLRPADARHRGPTDRAAVARCRPAPRLGRPHAAGRVPPRRAGRPVRRRSGGRRSAAATSASRWRRRSSPVVPRSRSSTSPRRLLRNLDPEMSERVVAAAERLGHRAPLRGARRGHHRDDRGRGRDGAARRRRRARPRRDAEQRAGRGRRPRDRGAQRHLRRRPPAHLGRRRLLGGRLCRVVAPGHREADVDRARHGGQQGGPRRRREPGRRRRRPSRACSAPPSPGWSTPRSPAPA